MSFTVCADIGSANLRVLLPGSDTRIHESSVTARYKNEARAFGFGDLAYRLIDRAGENIVTEYPVRGETVISRTALTDLFAYVLKLSEKERFARRPLLLLSMNGEYAMKDAAYCAFDAGFDEVTAVPSDAVSALGASFDPTGAKAAFVIDIGDTHMSAAIYTYGRAVRRMDLPFGLGETDEGIIRKVREVKGCRIGRQTAREMKHRFFSAVRMNEVTDTFVGLEIASELPREFSLESGAIESAAEPQLRSLMTMLRQMVTDLPEGICADLMETGAVLTGGGSRLFGLAGRIGERLGVPCRAAEDPDVCILNGLEMLNADAERLSRLTRLNVSREKPQ